jgi:hypothetical protein
VINLHKTINTLTDKLTLHFHFTAAIESLAEKSVFHFKIRELGIPASLDSSGVIADYVGDIRDKNFQILLKMFEQQPVHVITLSSK